jgi:predicted DCC family thiol-disulfide oxidoreductase YuxK
MRVAEAPRKPLMLFDGECQFCRFWIHRWSAQTREAVDYLPSQEFSVPRRFPEIPKKEYRQSVLLIEPSGVVYHGAEAAVRSLATNPRHRWMARIYYQVPGVRPVSEWAYKVVSAHRPRMAALNRLIFGRKAEQA